MYTLLSRTRVAETNYFVQCLRMRTQDGTSLKVRFAEKHSFFLEQ
jgi:hypothetical protein